MRFRLFKSFTVAVFSIILLLFFSLSLVAQPNDSTGKEKKKSFETKLTDLRAFEVRYDDFKAQAQAELQNTLSIAQKRIAEDVVSATRRVGETEGFNLVLNLNKANPAASDVLFAKNIDDITERVLASLNSTKPAPDVTSEKKPR